MLELTDVTVRFGGVAPLQDVTIRFGGKVCGLIGPNGAGKTTLLNVVSGLTRPARGSVHAGDTDLLRLSAHQRARWGLGRTFQQEQLVEELSVWDNVLVAAEHGGRRGAVRQAEAALLGVGLEQRVNERVARLDSLERKMLEIARATALDPKIILLDEPGAGLAEDETNRLARLIGAVQDRTEAMVLLVDHDMSLVRATCDTVAVLDFGRLIAQGPTSGVLDDERVRLAYLGTEDVA